MGSLNFLTVSLESHLLFIAWCVSIMDNFMFLWAKWIMGQLLIIVDFFMEVFLTSDCLIMSEEYPFFCRVNGLNS
jgi:hypothetical protein